MSILDWIFSFFASDPVADHEEKAEIDGGVPAKEIDEVDSEPAPGEERIEEYEGIWGVSGSIQAEDNMNPANSIEDMAVPPVPAGSEGDMFLDMTGSSGEDVVSSFDNDFGYDD